MVEHLQRQMEGRKGHMDLSFKFKAASSDEEMEIKEEEHASYFESVAVEHVHKSAPPLSI